MILLAFKITCCKVTVRTVILFSNHTRLRHDEHVNLLCRGLPGEFGGIGVASFGFELYNRQKWRDVSVFFFFHIL